MLLVCSRKVESIWCSIMQYVLSWDVLGVRERQLHLLLCRTIQCRGSTVLYHLLCRTIQRLWLIILYRVLGGPLCRSWERKLHPVLGWDLQRRVSRVVHQLRLWDLQCRWGIIVHNMLSWILHCLNWQHQLYDVQRRHREHRWSNTVRWVHSRKIRVSRKRQLHFVLHRHVQRCWSWIMHILFRRDLRWIHRKQQLRGLWRGPLQRRGGIDVLVLRCGPLLVVRERQLHGV